MCVGREGIVFMPQKSYMTAGSLRQQVVYPMIETDVGIEEDQIIAVRTSGGACMDYAVGQSGGVAWRWLISTDAWRNSWPSRRRL